jgi:hypothetical protein
LGNIGLTTGFGNSLGGYGSYGGVGTTYGKPPIDLGGVVLGTIIGIGAVLIIPKIAYIFSGHLGGAGGGGYYRSKRKIWDLTSKFKFNGNSNRRHS